MSDFEALFGLLSLMFGLIVAELAIKFADAIDSHGERPVGILTPALTFLVLTDVTSFWLWVWGARKVLEINWPTVFGGVLLAFVYFLAASLVFPRTSRGWTHLDDHYWSRKRLVAAGMLIANMVIIGSMLTRATPAWNDWWFYFNFGGYLIALAGLALNGDQLGGERCGRQRPGSAGDVARQRSIRSAARDRTVGLRSCAVESFQLVAQSPRQEFEFIERVAH